MRILESFSGAASRWRGDRAAATYFSFADSLSQTGHDPRVLLFSTARDASSDRPLAILRDHTFGVASLAFSQDGRWLCTLGNCYDGFICVYRINSNGSHVKLHSSNKCSNVSRVHWMGSSVISLGTRHVKMWRPEAPPNHSSSKPGISSKIDTPLTPGRSDLRVLYGRNCLLGDLKDATFVSAASISECKAIICSKQGDICLLDDSKKNQSFAKVVAVEEAINCVVFDQKNSLLWFAAEGGVIKSMHSHDLEKLPTAQTKSSASMSELAGLQSGCLAAGSMALSIVRDCIISQNNNRNIEILAIEKKNLQPPRLSLAKTLHAHRDDVLGICILPKSEGHEAKFLTYSAEGVVLLWTIDGVCTDKIEIPLEFSNDNIGESSDANGIKVVIPCGFSGLLLSGDKRGILRFV